MLANFSETEERKQELKVLAIRLQREVSVRCGYFKPEADNPQEDDWVLQGPCHPARLDTLKQIVAG